MKLRRNFIGDLFQLLVEVVIRLGTPEKVRKGLGVAGRKIARIIITQ